MVCDKFCHKPLETMAKTIFLICFFRVPSNCGRSFQLLAFDPDGDEVKCRYGNPSLSECIYCEKPPPLVLSSVSNVSKNVLYQTFPLHFSSSFFLLLLWMWYYYIFLFLREWHSSIFLHVLYAFLYVLFVQK